MRHVACGMGDCMLHLACTLAHAACRLQTCCMGACSAVQLRQNDEWLRAELEKVSRQLAAAADALQANCTDAAAVQRELLVRPSFCMRARRHGCASMRLRAMRQDKLDDRDGKVRALEEQVGSSPPARPPARPSAYLAARLSSVSTVSTPLPGRLSPLAGLAFERLRVTPCRPDHCSSSVVLGRRRRVPLHAAAVRGGSMAWHGMRLCIATAAMLRS
jgi:hypothetical protein